MGWFGSDNSQKQGDEFDLGHPLIYNDWTGNYVSRYDYIKNYLDDLYIFPKTVIDNVEHSQSLYIQHKFDEET